MRTFTDEVLLNEGAQGQVWKSRDQHGRPVAVKRLTPSPDPARQHVRLERFRREVACQSTLKHHAIVEVLYSDLDAAVPYFAMPLAEGTLRDILQMHSDGLPVDEAVRIFTAMTEGMAFAHSQQIIHRDLKPENILMFSGSPRISDFGIGRRLDANSASLTFVGVGMGTPRYMAPEQHRDAHSVEAPADVFALGCILYELLAGQPAANGIDYSLVPSALHYLLRVSTHHEPGQRFQSAVELLNELEVCGGARDSADPAEELTSLFDAVLQGEDRTDSLYRTLTEHAGDLDLYVNTLASAPRLVLQGLSRRREQFRWLIRTFDAHANGEFPTSAVDRISYFLWVVATVTNDDEVLLVALERVLVLAHQHERLYARDRFVDALSLAIQRPSITAAIRRILQRHPSARSFIRGSVNTSPLPTDVANALD